MTTNTFPRFRAYGDHGLFVDFSDGISIEANERALALDAALAAQPVPGLIEAVPSYASVFLAFDPMVTDHATVRQALSVLLSKPGKLKTKPVKRIVEVCYEAEYAPDLAAVAQQAGMSPEAAIACHLAGKYRVFMYGFAPGYAYLGGTPEALQFPRKAAAVRNMPAGCVMIAGPQCLVSTLVMPTGWWVIGRSPTPILNASDEKKPFLFNVGDTVEFVRIGRDGLT